MPTSEQVDRELAHTLRVAPLDARFDAAVLARIEALPPHRDAMQQGHGAGESDRTRRLLARERRALGISLALYGIGAAAFLALAANVLSHVAAAAIGPALQWSAALSLVATNATVWAAPLAAMVAALAVIGSGAWLFARDRHLGVI